MYIDTLKYRVDAWEVPQSSSSGFWKQLKEYDMNKKTYAMRKIAKLQEQGVPCRLVRVRRIDESVTEETLWESK